MSNRTVPAAAEGMPASPQQTLDEKRAVAAMDFKPWEGEPDPMSAQAWASWMPHLRMCYHVMHQTKEHLSAKTADDPDAAIIVMECVTRFRDFLHDMHSMAEDAAARVYIAATHADLRISGEAGGDK